MKMRWARANGLSLAPADGVPYTEHSFTAFVQWAMVANQD